MAERVFVCGVGVFACILLFPLPAIAQDPDTAQKSAESPEVVAGKAIFQQNCSFCHGANARGTSGPDLIHSTLVSHDVDGDLVGQVVRNGRPDKGMPPFQLTETQIRAIAAYLHSEAHLASTTYQRGPGEYPLDKLLVGNAAAGEAYFSEAKCAQPAIPRPAISRTSRPSTNQSICNRALLIPAGAVPIGYRHGTLGQGLHRLPGLVRTNSTSRCATKMTGFTPGTADSVKVDSQRSVGRARELLSTYSDENLHDLFTYLETLK